MSMPMRPGAMALLRGPFVDGYYRIRRSRYGDWDRIHLSREDMTQPLRAYARHELKKLLAMARGESHRGMYEIPEPSVRLLEQYASEIDQAFEQAATTLGVQSNVVQLR